MTACAVLSRPARGTDTGWVESATRSDTVHSSHHLASPHWSAVVSCGGNMPLDACEHRQESFDGHSAMCQSSFAYRSAVVRATIRRCQNPSNRLTPRWAPTGVVQVINGVFTSEQRCMSDMLMNLFVTPLRGAFTRSALATGANCVM